MPSAKRKPRRKTADLAENLHPDHLESSPSRPSAKKRKTNGTRTSTRQRHSMPAPQPIATEDSDEESETVSQGDLIDSIISYLNVSSHPITAATEHSNEKEQPDNMKRISAYAKIAGRDWTYFVREQCINIGRPPDVKDEPGLPFGASSPAQSLKELFPVHIDLGPSKIISRHHASIYYDSEVPKDGGWHIRINGRNGAKVNNLHVKRGGVVQLKSGAIFELCGTQMMFVTPGDKALIHPLFIDRAKALATGEEFGTTHSHPDLDEEFPELEVKNEASAGNYQSLAPAPPNFKRTTTPPLRDMKNGRGVFDSRPTHSPMYNRGLMMETTHEIDYSKDAARDLKPPFSYATMIAQAIFSSEEEKLTLSNIYAFIADKFAFYRHSNSGWQNSIRHNLSLNKAFQKVPRRTDEPGKGMKWQIAPEYRQEYWKKQQRRGGNSSNPSSPAGKEVNPNFRGPNGQNLGYDTTMVNQFSAKDMTEQSLQQRQNAHMNFQPFPLGQQASANPPTASQEAFTPQRRRTDTMTTDPDPNLDDSPLPHAHFRHSKESSIYPQPQQQQVYTLPPALPPLQQSPTNPTFTSYLDTPYPQHTSSNNPLANPHFPSSIITPAPLRQNPRLAPPSTLIAPSKFMPDSSPNGPSSFWKGAFGFSLGATPAAPPPDLSPDKVLPREAADPNRNIMSSSPPPMDGEGSPTKSFRQSFRGSQGPPVQSSQTLVSLPTTTSDESKTTTATNGTSTASTAPPTSVMNDAAIDSRTVPGMRHGNAGHNDDKEEAEEADGGFDLAKGFAPIGRRGANAARAGGI